MILQVSVVVVVQCYLWFNSYSPLFIFMLIYEMNMKQKKIKIEPRIKLNYNIYFTAWQISTTIHLLFGVNKLTLNAQIWSGSPQYLSCVHDRYPAIYVNDHLEVHCRFSFMACSGGHFEKKVRQLIKLCSPEILTPWKKFSITKCSQKLNKYLL